jgi:hypothetical protein
LEKAQLGLGHSYSRSKVKFNVNRVDNMIIQSISLLDTLDKDINTFCMRVRYALEINFESLRNGLGMVGLSSASQLICEKILSISELYVPLSFKINNHNDGYGCSFPGSGTHGTFQSW